MVSERNEFRRAIAPEFKLGLYEIDLMKEPSARLDAAERAWIEARDASKADRDNYDLKLGLSARARDLRAAQDEFLRVWLASTDTTRTIEMIRREIEHGERVE